MKCDLSTHTYHQPEPLITSYSPSPSAPGTLLWSFSLQNLITPSHSSFDFGILSPPIPDILISRTSENPFLSTARGLDSPADAEARWKYRTGVRHLVGDDAVVVGYESKGPDIDTTDASGSDALRGSPPTLGVTAAAMCVGEDD